MKAIKCLFSPLCFFHIWIVWTKLGMVIQTVSVVPTWDDVYSMYVCIYKVICDLSSFPYRPFSWRSPLPGSLALCWVCLSPCSCPYPCPSPSFLLLRAGGSWLRSGQKSCPEFLAPGRRWRWGRRGGAQRISRRRRARRGSEEQQQEGSGPDERLGFCFYWLTFCTS